VIVLTIPLIRVEQVCLNLHSRATEGLALVCVEPNLWTNPIHHKSGTAHDQFKL